MCAIVQTAFRMAIREKKAAPLWMTECTKAIVQTTCPLESEGCQCKRAQNLDLFPTSGGGCAASQLAAEEVTVPIWCRAHMCLVAGCWGSSIWENAGHIWVGCTIHTYILLVQDWSVWQTLKYSHKAKLFSFFFFAFAPAVHYIKWHIIPLT